MKVYVLLWEEDYEGAELIAVYSDPSDANAAAERKKPPSEYRRGSYEVYEADLL